MKQGDAYIIHNGDKLMKKCWQRNGDVVEFYSRTEVVDLMVPGRTEKQITYKGTVQIIVMTVNGKFNRIMKSQFPSSDIEQREQKDAMIRALSSYLEPSPE